MKPLENTLMCLDESFYKADFKKHAARIEGLVRSDWESRITPQDECVCVEPSDNAEHWNNIHVTFLKASTVGAHGRVCCYSFFLFILCKSFLLLIENTNKKRGWQKIKEFCSVSPVKLIHPKEVFSSTNPSAYLSNLKRNSSLSPDCHIMGGKNLKAEMKEMQNFCLLAFLTPVPLCVLSHLPLLYRPPSCSASVPIEMSNAAVVCKWKRGSLVGTACPSNLKASAVLFSPFWCFPSHFLSRCCVGQHRL